MNQSNASQQVVHKITLAWAISECALGGFFHAIQSPFTGLLVGGLSVVFISLIAFYAERRAVSILKAVIFVLGVKLAVSPHSPLGAYFAVSMQALLGILFFGIIPRFSWAAIVLGIMNLMGSAVQKVFILTLLFGVNFWEAIDKFAQDLALKMSYFTLDADFSISKWLIVFYISVYGIGGVFIGWLASKMPNILQYRALEFDDLIAQYDGHSNPNKEIVNNQNKWRLWSLMLAFVLFAIALQWIFFSAESALNQFLRTIGILLTWILILRPLFKWALQKLLQNKQDSLQHEIEQIQMLIPKLIAFAKFAWKERDFSAKNRLLNFISIYIYYAIYKS